MLNLGLSHLSCPTFPCPTFPNFSQTWACPTFRNQRLQVHRLQATGYRYDKTAETGYRFSFRTCGL